MAKPITWANETRKLGDLIPWGKNPRAVDADQAEHLKASLKKFGLVYPPLISPKGHIYDGHQREKVMAMMDEYTPETEIDCRVSSRMLTKKERLELVARLHENTGDWVPELVAELYDLADLEEWGAGDMAELVEWEEDDLPDDPGAQVDKADELREKWGVESGQVWQLGDHRVICGDCTDAAVVERLMGGERADLWIVDPPYGIDWQGSNASTLEWDEITGDKDNQLAETILGLLPKEHPAIFWGANCYPELLPHRGRWLCWDKRITEEADKMIGSPFELAWMNKKNGFDIIVRVQHGGALNADGGDRFHPTQKPVDLYSGAIQQAYKNIAQIYDPFLGSGTTLIACERLNRKCYGAEIEPKYVAIALERWHQLTGETPELTGGMPDDINGKEEK